MNSVQWATWISQTYGSKATSPWWCYNNQVAAKSGKTRFIALVILRVEYKRKPQRQKWDAAWPPCLLSTSVPLMGVLPEPPPCPTYLSGLLCTSTADTLWISECPMSQVELLPQPGCQTSGISRQIFKILKLYLDKISGSKRECIKGKVQYMVAFHTVPVKNSMAFCVEI